MRTIGLLTFMLPVGVMSACGILVGISVGAGKGDHAITYYETCMKVGVALAFLQVLILLIGKDLIPHFYTK